MWANTFYLKQVVHFFLVELARRTAEFPWDPIHH
jgi:hypothetical protein